MAAAAEMPNLLVPLDAQSKQQQQRFEFTHAQRLKCGEVYTWDCAGETYAIECALCEEKPLCTLQEFTEHMQIWHSNWEEEEAAAEKAAELTLSEIEDYIHDEQEEQKQQQPQQQQPQQQQQYKMQQCAAEEALSSDDDDDESQPHNVDDNYLEPFEQVLISSEVNNNEAECEAYEFNDNKSDNDNVKNQSQAEYESEQEHEHVHVQQQENEIYDNELECEHERRLVLELELELEVMGDNSMNDGNEIDRAAANEYAKQHELLQYGEVKDPTALSLNEQVRYGLNQPVRSSKLSSSKIEQLIELYKAHPRLWNKKHAEFSETKLTRESWQDITNKWNEYCHTNYTTTDVSIRISTLVQRYLRERERLAKAAARFAELQHNEHSNNNNDDDGDGDLSEQPKFVHYSKLQFLDEQQSLQSRRKHFQQQNSELLKIYQHFPILWHSREKHLKRPQAREKALTDISTALKLCGIYLSPSVVHKRLKTLHRYYRHEKINYLHAKVQRRAFEPSFKHFKDMQFLDKHIDPYVCDICGKIFKNILSYREHVHGEGHDEVMDKRKEAMQENENYAENVMVAQEEDEKDLEDKESGPKEEEETRKEDRCIEMEGKPDEGERRKARELGTKKEVQEEIEEEKGKEDEREGEEEIGKEHERDLKKGKQKEGVKEGEIVTVNKEEVEKEKGREVEENNGSRKLEEFLEKSKIKDNKQKTYTENLEEKEAHEKCENEREKRNIERTKRKEEMRKQEKEKEILKYKEEKNKKQNEEEREQRKINQNEAVVKEEVINEIQREKKQNDKEKQKDGENVEEDIKENKEKKQKKQDCEQLNESVQAEKKNNSDEEKSVGNEEENHQDNGENEQNKLERENMKWKRRVTRQMSENLTNDIKRVINVKRRKKSAEQEQMYQENMHKEQSLIEQREAEPMPTTKATVESEAAAKPTIDNENDLLLVNGLINMDMDLEITSTTDLNFEPLHNIVADSSMERYESVESECNISVPLAEVLPPFYVAANVTLTSTTNECNINDSNTQQQSIVEALPKPNEELIVNVECANFNYNLKINPSSISNEMQPTPKVKKNVKSKVKTVELEMDENSESFARLTVDQTHKLIELYNLYPQLWHPQHINYNSRKIRHMAWRALTAKLNKIYDLRYSWKTLQRKLTDYAKYYKREKQRIETEGSCTKWCFFDDFIFLDNVINLSAHLQHTIKRNEKKLNIIAAYKRYPQLWDTTHKDYTNRKERQNYFAEFIKCLQQIYKVKITMDKLKHEIIEFRRYYRKAKAQRLEADNRNETYTPDYQYYEALTFLDEHVAPFDCDKCPLSFKCMSYLERHRKKQHSTKRSYTRRQPAADDDGGEDASLENVCHICGIKFSQRSNLVYHLRRHMGQTSHTCSMCPKTFYNSTALKVHERTHTGDYPCVCEECGRRFVNMSKLNQHMKRHRNQRDHTCDQCGKAFYTAFERDRHILRHMNVRDKICNVCGRTFGVGSAYYAHMMLHSDVKRYSCELCGMKFAQYSGLYKHRKKHHYVST